MDFKIEEKVMYAGEKASVKGVIPAFFQAGSFPAGIDDIDARYMECDFDKSIVSVDTILIEVENQLIRVLPHALEKITEKPKKKTKKKEKK
jgi:hypothetical protein